MKRKYLFVGLIILISSLLFCSCEIISSYFENDNTENSTSEDEGDNTENSTSEDESDNDENSEVSTILGRGYDVFSEYADPQMVKSTILDFDAINNAGLVEKTSLNNTDYSEITGENKTSYQENLAENAGLEGDYGYFSGSLESAFSSSVTGSSDYSYGSILINVNKNMYAVQNRADTDMLKNYLDPTFDERINDSTYSVDKLFSIYGTHALVGIITGARCDYTIAESQSEIATSSSISADLKASFSSTFTTVSSTVGISSDSSTEVDTSSLQKNMNFVGGDSNQAVTDDGLSTWLNGIDDDNVVFANFTSNTSMVPIWDLCDDDTRATEIEEAFETYEEENNPEEETDDGIVTATIDFTSITGRGLKDGEKYGDGYVEFTWLIEAIGSDGTTKVIQDHYSDGADNGYITYVESQDTIYLETNSSGADPTPTLYPVDLSLEAGKSFTIRVSHVAEIDSSNNEGSDDDTGYCDGTSATTYTKTFYIDLHDTWNGQSYSTTFDDDSGENVGYGIITFNYTVTYTD